MIALFCVIASLCVAASAAPPATQQLYTQGPSQLQQINPLDYYLDNPEVSNYYQAQQKQGNVNSGSGVPARLENLEPDSEVELLPGAQQPQIPQQTPVSPNLPGLVPGQRVFIVHMPVPGYRPGTIGGYQPVYIVSAAPQGNTAYPTNGYQNGIILNHSGQAVVPSVLGYVRQPAVNVLPQGANPGVFYGAPLLNRPYELVYPDPGFAYQSAPAPHGSEGTKGNIRLAQLVTLQSQPNQPNNGNLREANEVQTNSNPKRISESSGESKESGEGSRRNPRPAPPSHTLARNKV